MKTPLGLATSHSAITLAVGGVIETSSVGAIVGAEVGGTAVGTGGVAAGAQAESNTLTSINTETGNLRASIFFSCMKYLKSIVVLISVHIFAQGHLFSV